MTHIGLFEGIGGFSLAARWMGWETVAWSEWNEFCQKVLRHHFPEAEGFGDITKTDFTKYADKIDILTGGFPCQPYSLAGQRLGKEDDRHLWPQMLRAIREIKPRWVVGENVYGLVNWNGGMVFNEVQTDLEAEGYEVQPYVIPACAVNAPHRRDRIWFVAHSISAGAGRESGTINNEGRGTSEDWGEGIRQAYGQASTSGINTTGTNGPTKNTNGNGRDGFKRQEESGVGQFGNIGTGNNERISTDDGEIGTIADANKLNGNISGLRTGEIPQQQEARIFEDSTDSQRKGLEGRIGPQESIRPESGSEENDVANSERIRQSGQGRPKGQGGAEKNRDWKASWSDPDGEWPLESPLCGRNDGISSRLAGITVSKHRNESLKAYGNAIVPQVALMIFKAIKEYEDAISNT